MADQRHDLNIISPHELGMLGKQTAQRAAEHQQFGVELDISGTELKTYFAPLLPWEICLIQGQTHNGKTELANWWVRKAAEQLRKQGREEIIVYVHYEEPLEAVAFAEYGRILEQSPSDFARGTYTDFAKMDWAMTVIDQIPVWHIGDSAARPEDAPDLTLSNVYRSIRELLTGKITGQQFKPALVVVDYLQIIPFDPELKRAVEKDKRRLQVANDVKRLRQMTTHLECPILVTGQCKQELKGNNPPMMIPGMYDGYETSEIAMRFDRILSIWRCKTTHQVGSTFTTPDGVTQNVTENLAYIKVNKQRGGLPSGKVFAAKVEYPAGDYVSLYGRPIADRERADLA